MSFHILQDPASGVLPVMQASIRFHDMGASRRGYTRKSGMGESLDQTGNSTPAWQATFGFAGTGHGVRRAVR